MSRILKTVFAAAALALLGLGAHAFTPLGNWDTWMDTRKNYRMGGDIGGPMNINEEFRYNVPTLYYAFDNTFLSYFGQRGVEEVEKAVAMMNALPGMSTINVDDYPLEVRRLNARAQALALMDLKTVTLGVLMELMGVAEAPRYVFTLRDVVDLPCCNTFVVVRRNFDPITGRPTSFINGTLWTYNNIVCACTPVLIAYVVNEPVDPLAVTEPVANMFGLFSRFGNGQFFSTLSRDDVGALRHIYRRDNRNYESLPGTVNGNGAGGVWGIPGTGGTNNFVGNAVRYGIDKVTFVRTDYDSLLGELYAPFTNTWTEQIITNGVTRDQQLARAVLVPDFVFSGADLLAAAVARGISWSNNPVLNGTITAGPGIIIPNSGIIYNTTGPLLVNPNGFFVAETNGIPVFTWASFDSSTNVTVYPYTATVNDLENRILGSGGGNVGGPFSLPPIQFNMQAVGGGGGGAGP